MVKAGHVHLPPPASTKPDQSPAPPMVDPLQKADPWRAYYNRNQAAVLLGRLPQAVLCQRTARWSSKFQAHDERMQSLEVAVKDLQEGQRQQEKQRQADREEVSHNFSQLSTQFVASVEALQHSQQLQQEQLVTSKNERKSLVLSSRVGGDQPKKRPADMDWQADGNH